MNNESLDPRTQWLMNLQPGDDVVYEASNYMKKYPWYYEDRVKRVDWPAIETEFGLVFIEGRVWMNGQPLRLENPHDDYLGSGNNLCYLEFKKQNRTNITPFMAQDDLKLNKAISHIASCQEDSMAKHTYISDWKNALIEDSIRDKEHINYFDSLMPCISASTKGAMLYIGDKPFAKRASKTVGKYRIYRNCIQGKNYITKWQISEIYVLNTETGEIRRDPHPSINYTWYWLEQELKSYDDTFQCKYDPCDTDMAFILEQMKG